LRVRWPGTASAAQVNWPARANRAGRWIQAAVWLALPALALFALPGSGAPIVRYEAGLLSVHADHVSLSTVLAEVGDKTGIDIRTAERYEDLVSVRLSRLALADALNALLEHFNYAILQDRLADGEMRPVLVVILGRADSGPIDAISPVEGGYPKGGMSAEERLQELQVMALAGNDAGLRKALSDPDPDIRAAALDLLVERDRLGAIDLLLEATRSPEPKVRRRAFELLASSEHASEATVLRLLGQAIADSDMQVKSAAIRALAERGGPEPLERLRQTLHDPDSSIRLITLENIVRSVPAEQGAALLEEAAADENEEVRSAARSWMQARQGSLLDSRLTPNRSSPGK
jgi:HEAT repeat protein